MPGSLQTISDEQLFQLSYQRDQQPFAQALLLAMPEPDFMLAVEEILPQIRRGWEMAERITKICSARGAPYKCSVAGGFEWVGDTEVRRELIEPALAAIHDPPEGSAASSSKHGLSCAKARRLPVRRRSTKLAVPSRAL